MRGMGQGGKGKGTLSGVVGAHSVLLRGILLAEEGEGWGVGLKFSVAKQCMYRGGMKHLP